MDSDIKMKIHQHLIRKTDFLKVKDKLTEDELRRFVDKAITDMCNEDGTELNFEVRAAIIRELASAVVSLGPLRPLVEDKGITEIMINGPDHIYIQREGKIMLSDIRFDHSQHLLHTIQKMLAASGTNRRVDESSPYVDFPLGDGSRVNVLLPPCSLIGPVMTIRKFADIQTVDDFIGLEMLDRRMSDLLIAAMKGKLNIIFCGATGTGKTTTLNIFSQHIPSHERIITIEDTPELRLKQAHVVTLQSKPANIEGRGEITIRDLFVNSLRMRPDRIIIGEVRSKEMLDLIESIASGHSGSLAIVHAESPEDCFNRMMTMMLLTGIPLRTEVIQEQISSAIDMIVHCELMPDGNRKITHITDIYWDKEQQKAVMKDIFWFIQKEITEDGKIVGTWDMDRREPSFYKKFIKRNVKLPAGFFAA